MMNFLCRIVATFLLFSVLFVNYSHATGGVLQEHPFDRELRSLNEQRRALYREHNPGFMIRPLTDEASGLLGHGGGKYIIDYGSYADVKERESRYQPIMDTAIMHSRTSFFEHQYILDPRFVTDDRYYGHLAAIFVVHTATQILEGAATMTTVLAMGVEGLRKQTHAYVQRIIEYQDTAFRTMTDEVTAAKMLAVLAGYTMRYYQGLLIDSFLKVYQTVKSRHPALPRNEQAIELGKARELLLATPFEREGLEIVFKDGVRGLYTQEGGFNFQGPVRLVIQRMEMTKEKTEYNGVIIRHGLPVARIKDDIKSSVKSATVKKVKKAPDELYVEVAEPYQRSKNPDGDQKTAKSVGYLRGYLGISSEYMVLGSRLAAEHAPIFENNLAKTILHTTMDEEQALPYDRGILSCNEALELDEHAAQVSSEVGHRNLGIACINYGVYLTNYSIENYGTLSINMVIDLRRRAVKLKEKGCPLCQDERSIRSLASSKRELGQALNEKALRLTTLSHIEKVQLFEESLKLLKEAIELGRKESHVDLATCTYNYGAYLNEYSMEIGNSIPMDTVISLRRQAVKLFEKALASGEKKSAEAIVGAKNLLGVALTVKASSSAALPHAETVDLFKEALAIFTEVAKPDLKAIHTNFLRVTHNYGAYLFNYSVSLEKTLPLDMVISLRRQALELLEKAQRAGFKNDPEELENVKYKLGVALYEKTRTKPSLPHIEIVALFKEGLAQLEEAAKTDFKAARTDYVVILNNYGTYLLNRSILLKATLTLDQIIELRQEGVKLLEKAYEAALKESYEYQRILQELTSARAGLADALAQKVGV